LLETRLSYSGEKGILLTKGPQEISKTRSSGDAPEAARPFRLKISPWLILICVCCGLLIKLPEILNFEERDFLFFERNAGLIVLFGLSGYAFSSRKVYKPEHSLVKSGPFYLSAIYVNVLPTNRDSAVINLIYIHLPLMLWCLYGLILLILI
jgi:hypothetical protein